MVDPTVVLVRTVPGSNLLIQLVKTTNKRADGQKNIAKSGYPTVQFRHDDRIIMSSTLTLISL
jgi:hypothetical protein